MTASLTCVRRVQVAVAEVERRQLRRQAVRLVGGEDGAADEPERRLREVGSDERIAGPPLRASAVRPQLPDRGAGAVVPGVPEVPVIGP